jgi:hypothetical protein
LSEYLYRVGIDWASQHHQVCIVDREGHRTEDTVPHTGAGLAALADQLAALSPGAPERVAIASEVPRGPVVETLLERGADRPAPLSARPRRRPADHRTAGALPPRRPWFWALLDLALARRPQPLAIKAVRAVLKVHRIRRVTAETVHAAVQVPPVRVAPGTLEAVGAHLAVLLPQLRLVHDQRHRTVGPRIDRVLAALAQEAVAGEHRDVTILRSLPGVGRHVAATVLAEAARPLAERDYQTLRAQAGAAPVTRQSGRKAVVTMRWACNSRRA